MKLTVRPTLEPFLRALQRTYARVIRAGAPRVPHADTQGPPGGSLAQDVLRADLVRAGRTAGSFMPSRLGLRFRLWWNGSSHQRARGREVAIDEARLTRTLEEELARQVEAADRRAS